MNHKTDIRQDGTVTNSTTDIDMKIADVRLDNNALCVDCQSSNRQITDYFAGELSAPASEQLMAHLEACETCRKAFEEFDELWSSAGEVLAEDNIIDGLSEDRRDFIANAQALATKTKKKSPTVTRRIIEYSAVAAILFIFAGMLLPALKLPFNKSQALAARYDLQLKNLKDTIATDIADDEMTEGTSSSAGGIKTPALHMYPTGAVKSNRGRSRTRRTAVAAKPIVLRRKVAKKMLRIEAEPKSSADGFDAAGRNDTFGDDSDAIGQTRVAVQRSALSLVKELKKEVAPVVVEESLDSGAFSKRKKSQRLRLSVEHRIKKMQLLPGSVGSSSSLRRSGAKSKQKFILEKRLNQPVKIILKKDEIMADSLESNRQLRETESDANQSEASIRNEYAKKNILNSKNVRSYAGISKALQHKRVARIRRLVFKINLKLWNITTVQNLRVLMQQRGYPLTARVSINRHNNTITFYDTAHNLTKAAKLFTELQAAEQELKNFRNGIPMVKTKLRPISTFSIDTDTASYIQAKRQIMNGQRPDPMKIREEEFVNYFDYHYCSPKKTVFGVYLEAAPAPFRPGKVLLRIGVQGKKLGPNSGAASRYTVLFDGSGSMAAGNRLELAFKTLQLLFKKLTVKDQVSLIVCNEQPTLLFSNKHLGNKTAIARELNRIKPAGAADFNRGLKMAYRTALRNYLSGGINKVIIISDGIVKLPKAQLSEVMLEIDRSRRRGISNIVIGVGGDGDDQLLEKLAAAGDGSYVFIDREQDAIELFNQQFDARFREIAKDVKIQVEFNAVAVPEYRQIGYRNRHLSKADFRNDKINAGEVGSGQSVTALYEMKLNRELPAKTMLAIVRLRYKPIDSDEVIEEEFVITSNEVDRSFTTATPSFKLAAFVAEFAESLRYPETPGIASGAGIAAKLSPLFQRKFSNDGKVAELLMLTRKVR